jgi:hypothetical protein
MKIQIKNSDIQKRDPVARALSSGEFRPRVVRDRTKYTRKQKHRKAL